MKKSLCFSLITALALCLLQTAHAQGNREANSLARRGTDAAKNQEWDEAIEDLRKATDLDRKYAPSLAVALQGRATAYAAAQRFQEAAADLDEAIKVNPRNASAYEGRASVAIKMNDFDKAAAMYSEAIKLNPHELRYYLYRSYVYELKGDLKNSMADTEKVLKLDKGNAEALSRKARLETRLRQAAELNPPPPAPNPPQPVPAPTKHP
jgi:tetratricopeptide (TPR) repeat protein